MSALMPTIIPISEAKPRLAALIDTSETEDVVLTRRGHAAAVLISTDRYTQLLDRLEDLEDSLDAARAAGEPSSPADEVYARIGLND
ncbi:MAG: type II toxin-antitoxin system Phd/YefM family antitoxin [Propionibacteriaceae bacterium]|jgi:prevent-host-death family protein|nr:type II toxin-antitoxin system Phd/YefM family antitoxin [Propionibacteriaceae bacterium]